MPPHLVTLVNPNLVHPPITPYALDILGTSLEAAGFEVEVLDLTFTRDTWRSAVTEYFSSRRPLLVGVTVRNTDTIYPQEQKVFIDGHREIIEEIKSVTSAPIVAGGVGFSSMPFALTSYFGIPYGIKGPGERIVCELAARLRDGLSPSDVRGLIVNTAGSVEMVQGGYGNGVPAIPPRADTGRVWAVNRATPYTRRSGVPYRVDNLAYYENGGLGNIITKNGCSFACSHCVEPDAKGSRFARRDVGAVVEEMESLVRQGVHDLHTTDSEFNLSIGFSKEVLREIIRRKAVDIDSPLHSLRLWVYCQPAPFDAEFAVLLSQAGCKGLNVSPDHVRDELLESWKVTVAGQRYYTFDDVQRVCRLCRENGMLVMIEVLLGMPGENLDTLRDCIDRTLALDTTVVGYTLGIRVFPYSPMGIRMAAESGGTRVVRGLQSNTAVTPILLKPIDACESVVEYERQFMFDEAGRLRPLYYFSPDLPEDEETLARPDGRWLRTLEFMWEHIPADEHHRVMLPTAPGLTKDDNNYADNPFLLCLAGLGYKGAFWSRWRKRDDIIRQAAERRMQVAVG